jgi:hypothetical protein
VLSASDPVRATDYNLYFSRNIVGMRWVRHVAGMREMRNAFKVVLESLKERDYMEGLGMNGKIL